MDCCAVFGNHTSGCLWCLFFGLVCWIRIHECNINNLLHYVDDAFNASFSSDLTYYEPYKCSMPFDQAQFLNLLDEIGLPHEDGKQQHGEILDIIRFTVNLQDLSISMLEESK